MIFIWSLSELIVRPNNFILDYIFEKIKNIKITVIYKLDFYILFFVYFNSNYSNYLILKV